MKIAGRSTSRPALVLWLACAALAGCAGTSNQSGSSSDVAQANLDLGVAYLRQNRPDLAVDFLERALRADARSAGAHNALALAHDALENLEEAEQHYERAVRLAPSDPVIANSYAVFLCRRLNRWRDAEPHFQRAISSPRYATPVAALTNAGYCARNAGDIDRAEEYLREALARDATYADALRGMLEISHDGENYLQARAFLQRYLAVRSATADVLLRCYDIERELQNTDAAQACASRLSDEFPLSPEVVQLRQSERDAR